MSSFTGSDIVKALEQLNIWKSLVTLPKRVAALEARLAALEKGQTEASGPAPDACPYCDATMVLTAERNHPVFGAMGRKVHMFHCDNCGKDVNRDWSPKEGYL
ncbi:hypothetical protein [Methylovirgula sp. 4M-Z18]|uniref:hypothetical protein n=1 Tax=Methylovirgula sp. 4M-Z18 TaxID=2293567 RepID=UPI000E2E5A42|nr:hypothetical protein [Methylovirgula sp. 4M-Z18]RFB80427.1 hypothetical protein DYH55_02545 [Methylovirgula sp. 4M-Z18]